MFWPGEFHGVAKSWTWLSSFHFHIPLVLPWVCWLECFRLRWKKRPYLLGRQRVFALRTRKQRLALWSWHAALLRLRGSVLLARLCERWACCSVAGVPCGSDAVFEHDGIQRGMLVSPERLEWWSSNLFQHAARGSLTLSQMGGRWVLVYISSRAPISTPVYVLPPSLAPWLF